MQRLNETSHWRKRAKEARALANDLCGDDAKRKMREIADTYDWLAEKAIKREEAARAAGHNGAPLQPVWGFARH